MAVSFDIPSPSKAFLKPSMPPTVAGCLRAMGAFAPQDLVTMSSGWVERQVPFLLSKMEGMHIRKGFSKSAEGNLLHSCLGPDIRTCILVIDGSVGKQISLFEVFL